MSYHCPPDPVPRFNLEAVIICDGYDDFLQVTMPYTLHNVDRLIVGTSEDDEKTRELCRKYRVQTVLTDEHRRHRGPFNKGRLIERCLQHCSLDSWRLHLDADIVLPFRMRHYLQVSDLDIKGIYGADRVRITNRKQWEKLLATGWLTAPLDFMMKPPEGFPLCGRFIHERMGYVPLGFFQLWHSSQDEWRGARIRPYPELHGNACRTDVQHGLQWDRRHRHLLPELAVVHIESEAAVMGANWNGRKTRRF